MKKESRIELIKRAILVKRSNETRMNNGLKEAVDMENKLTTSIKILYMYEIRGVTRVGLTYEYNQDRSYHTRRGWGAQSI